MAGIPRVQTCCYFFDLIAGGKLLGFFGTLLSIGYLAKSLFVLRDVGGYEAKEESDDALNDDPEAIYTLYISTLFVGFFLLVTSLFMVYGATQQIAKYTFPFLIGILFSVWWMLILAGVEIMDSSIEHAVVLIILAVIQMYFWLCGVSLYNQLLETEVKKRQAV